MTLALIALNAVALIAAFLVLDRKDNRAQQVLLERDAAHRLEVAGLIGQLVVQSKAHREEVQMLCQRLQAPEVAVMQHQIDTAGPAEAVMPFTDEESARREQREILERIEQMERNEGLAG